MKRLWLILLIISSVYGQDVFEPKMPWETQNQREGQSLIAHLKYWRNSAANEKGIKLNTKHIYDYSTNEINNTVITRTTYWDINWGSRDTTIRVEFFDENNNLIFMSDKEVVNGDTIALFNMTYTYDSNNNRTEYKHVSVDDGLILQAFKYSNSYDANNNLIEVKKYSMDWGTQSYNSNPAIYSHSYDENNNRDTTIVQLFHFSYKIMWNHSKYVYSYDSNNNVTEVVKYTWDYVSGTSWDKSWTRQYVYDSYNNMIEHVDNGGNHYFFSYDSDGRLIEYKSPTKIYTLSHNSILTTSEGKKPNGEISGKSEYYFKNLLSTETEIGVPSKFSISQPYPNPFNPKVTFNISIPQNNIVLINIYDISGRLVEEIANTNLVTGVHRFTWDAKGRTSGVYFVQAVYNGEVQNQKIILVK